MCFGCSKEPSHLDGSFEYPQHMFWLRNKKNNFPVCTLIWRPEYGLTAGVFDHVAYPGEDLSKTVEPVYGQISQGHGSGLLATVGSEIITLKYSAM